MYHHVSFHHISALDSFIHVKWSVTVPTSCQMLGMLHADAVASAEVLVHVITNIEGECPIQLQEPYDPRVVDLSYLMSQKWMVWHGLNVFFSYGESIFQ